MLEFGLSQRAVLAVADRADDVAALITRRLTAAGAQDLNPDTIRALVQQAVHDIRKDWQGGLRGS